MRNPFGNSYLSAAYLIEQWTYRLECSDRRVRSRFYKAVLHVINGRAADRGLEARIWILWDTFVGTVPGLEVHDGRPVVGEVLRELASRTRCLIRVPFLGIHECLERVLYWLAGRMACWKRIGQTPPTIWWRCGDGETPGCTKGSRRSTTSCEHWNRINAIVGAISTKAKMDFHCILTRLCSIGDKQERRVWATLPFLCTISSENRLSYMRLTYTDRSLIKGAMPLI